MINKNQIKKIQENYDKYNNLIDKSECHSIDLDKVEFYILIGIIFFFFCDDYYISHIKNFKN